MSVDLGYFFSTRIPKLVVSGGRRGADNQAEYKSDPKSHVVPCPGELYRSSEPPATPSWASVLQSGGSTMLKHFDHLTIVVRDVERAKEFFAVLGFKEAASVVISGEPLRYRLG